MAETFVAGHGLCPQKRRAALFARQFLPHGIEFGRCAPRQREALSGAVGRFGGVPDTQFIA